MLAMTIMEVNPKIKILVFFAIDPRNEVIKDCSVFFTLISFSEEKILINEGSKRKVTNEINNTLFTPTKLWYAKY